MSIPSKGQELMKLSAKSSNFICDSTRIDQFEPKSSNSFDIYRQQMLQQYCDILPIPLDKWNEAQTYREQDIAFVMLTGLPYYRNRAMATHDTWLSRASRYYFLSATPNDYLPVTVVAGAGEDSASNIKKLFYGLQIVYKQQMLLLPHDRQKWFYMSSCDAFTFVPHLLKRLDSYNHTQPLLIGTYLGMALCAGDNKTTFSTPFPAGGAGFFFSFKLLEAMQPHLSYYFENMWFPDNIFSDAALACLAFRLGVVLTNISGSWPGNPLATLRDYGYKNLHNDPEINSFHYISPREMYALDEFYVLQHVDRLTKNDNSKELNQFINSFIIAHYKLIRKKNETCILP